MLAQAFDCRPGDQSLWALLARFRGKHLLIVLPLLGNTSKHERQDAPEAAEQGGEGTGRPGSRGTRPARASRRRRQHKPDQIFTTREKVVKI